MDAVERRWVVINVAVAERGPRGYRFHVGLVYPQIHLLARESVHRDVLKHDALVADVVSSAWRVTRRVADPVLIVVSVVPRVPRRRHARVGGCGHLGLVQQPRASRPRVDGRWVCGVYSLRKCAKGVGWIATRSGTSIRLPFVQGRRVVDVFVGPVFVPRVSRQVDAHDGGPVRVQPVARQLPPGAAAVRVVVAPFARALVHVGAAAERARIAVIVASVVPAYGAKVVVPNLEAAQVDLDLLRPELLARRRAGRERVAGSVGVRARDHASRSGHDLRADLRVHVDPRPIKVPVLQNRATAVAAHAVQEVEVGLNLIDACAIAQGQFAAVELAGREVVVVLVVRQAAPEEVLALLELLPRAPRAALGGRLRSRWPVLKVDGVEMEEPLVRRVRVGRMGGRDERNGGKGEPPLRRADRPRHARSCNQQAPTPHTTRYAPRSSRFTHPLPRTESAVIYDKEGFGRTRLHAQRRASGSNDAHVCCRALRARPRFPAAQLPPCGKSRRRLDRYSSAPIPEFLSHPSALGRTDNG